MFCLRQDIHTLKRFQFCFEMYHFEETKFSFSAMSISYLRSELAPISTDKHGEAQINTEFVLIRAIFQHLKS